MYSPFTHSLTHSLAAHELWEAITDTQTISDPLSHGVWYRNCDKYENADICNNNYGIISVSGDSLRGNKMNYNLQINGHYYLTQHNWLRNSTFYNGPEKCAISADGTELNDNSLSDVALYLIYIVLLLVPFCCCCILYFMCCYGNAHGPKKDTMDLGDQDDPYTYAHATTLREI